MESRKKLDLLALASVPLIMTLGNSMLIPVLPVIEKRLQISSLQVSMIITVYSIFAIFLIPIAGYLSDRFGRKKIIIPSLLLAAVGGALTGWASWQMANPFWVILIGRAIQGIGSAGAMPVVMPCVGDMFKDEQEITKGLGLIETANTFGKVLSPILGAFLAAMIWFLPFWFIPILCLISILLVIFLVKVPKNDSSSESEQKKKSIKQFLKDLKKTLKENIGWLMAIFILGAIIMLVLFGVLFYLSTILEERYHIVNTKKGLVMAIPLLALSISSFVAGKKVGNNKIVMKWSAFFGFLLLTCSFIILFFNTSLFSILLTLVLGGIGIGAALPSLDALITEGIEKEERGTITSLYSSMRFVGVAAGPPLYTLLMKWSDMAVFQTSLGVSAVGAILVLKAIKPKPEGGVKLKKAEV
ncbi:MULTISPECIES: MFS transporter [Priestia]|jgi:MFS transporter, ACDE family, multidrug resistance protein|uniref:Transporter, major facilitator family n=2 Tax=Priestia megaterium TaxID=1404 RepID=D5DD82_PRIM3|nr:MULTISPECIES: MFS transporter [Priestia]ADF38312.1 transporter, major facilitator family [Priestia megaterium DSM 319]AJI20847.1 bacillibactin exporter [Priestia megaterium NBRC 15308 = ATCC 14581]AYE52106.1 MFS transporter [Priestia megaterium NCT-2]KFM96724.1 bacillibactin exporter [Priestia megaterium]KGJ85275.1 MFS transporter [Priestia megaterium NBRC 15308 = ATCC 14581]